MTSDPRRVPAAEMKVALSKSDNIKFNPGRRAEIKYRDLGTAEATGGEMRAEIMHIDGAGPSRPTGWHYHTADVQFLLMIKGWVKMEFADLGQITLNEGESITIPGGVVHQELCSSEPMRLLEISIPAKMQTVNVATPATGKENAAAYGEISVPLE